MWEMKRRITNNIGQRGHFESETNGGNIKCCTTNWKISTIHPNELNDRRIEN